MGFPLSVTRYFLLCGYTPFDRDSQYEEMQAIVRGDYKFEPVRPSTFAPHSSATDIRHSRRRSTGKASPSKPGSLFENASPSIRQTDPRQKSCCRTHGLRTSKSTTLPRRKDLLPTCCRKSRRRSMPGRLVRPVFPILILFTVLMMHWSTL